MELWREELYLSHHGIKGQKWGERNYQYEDGTLTPEGKRRYGVGDGSKKRSFFQRNKSVVSAKKQDVSVSAKKTIKSAWKNEVVGRQNEAGSVKGVVERGLARSGAASVVALLGGCGSKSSSAFIRGW